MSIGQVLIGQSFWDENFLPHFSKVEKYPFYQIKHKYMQRHEKNVFKGFLEVVYHSGMSKIFCHISKEFFGVS